MNINVEHQPNCRAVAHIRVPAAEVSKQRSAITSYYASQVRLPGFRPGKAPAAAVRKRYSADIEAELEKQLINDGLRQAIKNEGLEVLNILSVTDKMVHDTDQSFSFSAEMSLAPKFELPEYKGIPVKLPRVEVTDADVDHDILHLRERHASFQDVERGAQNGDAVVLTATGSLDGEPLAETMPDAPQHLREIKENWFLLDDEEDFLPGFYAGLNGIRKDETRTLTIPLPEDFPYEPLRQKNIEFTVNCKGVKEKKVPELDGDLLKKIGGEELTVEMLRGEVREAIRRRREEARENGKGNQVIAHIFEKVEFDLPQEIVNREAQRRTNEMAMRAMQQGLSHEELLKHQDEILGSATHQARQSIKVSFILEQVAQKENLEVTQQQLMHALANLAARQNKPVKKFMAEAQKSGLISSLQEDLLLQNAMQFLKDNAIVEETDPEPEVCEQHPAAAA
ncbi:MAG TPA: trigger factor [Verrucomicrobiales bacterium]|nr:trigger factor [Verrucomicrobiales bacterium]HCN78344.1 trigger factor [Verrucomicrobiales bacterium]HRJ10106.1 trigger factor [Prosthecobacter sp.]HRK16398.1 trigger factor [Prosthecobacter sp.]